MSNNYEQEKNLSSRVEIAEKTPNYLEMDDASKNKIKEK